MGNKTSDSTQLYECIRHPGRFSPQRRCATFERDGSQEGQGEYCACCPECVEVCLKEAHGHGGLRSKEWNYKTKKCKICGEDISRWLQK